MIERVLQLWSEGYTTHDIAKKYEVPVRTIEMILIQQGVYF